MPTALPATTTTPDGVTSTEEGKLLKKRYAVFNDDGSLEEGVDLKKERIKLLYRMTPPVVHVDSLRWREIKEELREAAAAYVGFCRSAGSYAPGKVKAAAEAALASRTAACMALTVSDGCPCTTVRVQSPQ